LVSEVSKSFSTELLTITRLEELGCGENIDKPEYSQPLSTAIQIALYELLVSFGITPKVVVGHSSGEIAAAYASGGLSLTSACKASYFRGLLAGKLREAKVSSPGAMLSINLAAHEVPEFLAKTGNTSVNVACINSPLSSTLSGLEEAIDAIKAQADLDGIFAQKLRTGVAYHSPSMKAIADEYLAALGDLNPEKKDEVEIPMISSVTGKLISHETSSTGQYWVDNMLSPVLFAQALQAMTSKESAKKLGLGNITNLVEIGPHPALRRPVKDTLSSLGNPKKEVRYAYPLHRSHLATQTTLELVGQLFCQGYDISIPAVNQQSAKGKFLVDCPEYPFDQAQRYWTESRLSRDFRLRGSVKGAMLGVRASDWNPLEPRWRNFWSIESSPWIRDHKISDTVLFPASGMLIMAMEATQQMVPSGQPVAGYLIHRAEFISPIIVPEAWEDRVETQVRLRTLKTQQNVKFDVTIFTYSRGEWIECFRANTQIDYKESSETNERRFTHEYLRDQYHRTAKSCSLPVDSRVLYHGAEDIGLQYGDWFQLLRNIHWDGVTSAVALVDLPRLKYDTTSLVHPAILDQAFHVLRASAGQQPAANVPVRLEDAWFSADGWQKSRTNSVRWSSKSALTVYGYGEQGSITALAEDGTILCSIENAVTAAVSRETTEKERKLVHSVEWKPQLDQLSPKQLTQVLNANAPSKDDSAVLANHSKLCRALELVAARTLKRIDKAKVPEDLLRHVEWMEHHVSKLSRKQQLEADTIIDDDVEARLMEVDSVLPAWKLYTTCARKLPEILAGELDPLQVVFESDQADIFYSHLFQNLCADGRLNYLLDLTSHQNPALRVLEVGAGTGGMTGHVISALQEREKRTGGLSFSEYTYTDISPAFFETASQRWPDLHSQGRISFKTLDLARSIESQGFEPQSYDLVIAASVLHATPYLEATTRNVQKALKPGGRLILLEVINPDDIATNFMAGLVPGWWVAREEWRPHSAAIPENLWDKCLRDNGFSGNDVVIRDYPDDECHIMSVIVTTAVTEPTEAVEQATKKGRIFILIDEHESQQQRQLADGVRRQLDPDGSRRTTIVAFSLDQLRSQLAELTSDDCVICLSEAGGRPLLSSLSDSEFTCLQFLISKISNLLWVTSTNAATPDFPDYSIAQGFFRSIRAEQPDTHIVTLSIQDEAENGPCTEPISQVFQATFDSAAPSKDVEYVVRDGLITTGRAIEDIATNKLVQSLTSPQVQQRAWGDGPALKLSMGKPGTLDSLQFIEDDVHATELGPFEIEIEAKAWGLSSRDLGIALGHLDARNETFGSDCAGIIKRIGHKCDMSIQPGDRVGMMAPGCLQKYPRAHEASVFKLPDALSFEAAVSTIAPGLAACYSVHNVSQLQEDDKVLVHSAAGGAGQIAVRLAQMLGAHVFVTASSAEEKQFLIDTLGIATEHIFDSKSASFPQVVMRATGRCGVDVVLNFSDQDTLNQSFSCLAIGGRCIHVGSINNADDLVLPTKLLTRNVTFSSVDVLSLSPKVIGQLSKIMMKLLDNSKIQLPQPLRAFEVPQIDNAFRELQENERLGRVVITVKPDDVVPQFIKNSRPWNFDEDSTYLVAGGSGGLGRAITKWMVSRGAKHLIVPSRSGATSQAAAQLLSELRSRGVNIVAPKCDVSLRENMANMLQDCARTMPPIKGCINAAMVLQDAIFQTNMTFKQWGLTMRSKVQTSKNLHELLPKDLDFFILLSSLAGVVGQMASANYAAGCSYQDCLASYRVAHGQKALSLDIGWMRNIGIIAESEAYQRQRQTSNDMQPIDAKELLSLLTLCCDPNNPPVLPPQAQGQILFGLRTPADILKEGQQPPALLEQPLLATFSNLVDGKNPAYREIDHIENARDLFQQSSEAKERQQIVIRAIAAKLARAMSISADDVESSKPLSSYGVDSLMAVELRNWINKEFSATVAVFDIIGGVPIASIAEGIEAKSSI
jgi:NADPH:quinone reductase-like Zn-dependent oxidoreductase/malonyl CoA-acyl carrier protein transacylase/SAM-dependent methyltransferase/acyl carrier protein